MKRETRFPWWGWLGVACLLPVIYVLSVFPVIWMAVRFDMEFPDWLQAFYQPVEWAVTEWEWFGKVVNGIVEWMGLK